MKAGFASFTIRTAISPWRHGLRQGEHVRVPARPREGRARSEADRAARRSRGRSSGGSRRPRRRRRSAPLPATPPAHDQARRALDQRLGQVLQLGGRARRSAWRPPRPPRVRAAAVRASTSLRRQRRDLHAPRGRGAAGRARSAPSAPGQARDPLVGVGRRHRVAGLDVDHAGRVPLAERVRPPERRRRTPPARSTSRGSQRRATGSSARPRRRDGGSRRSRTPPGSPRGGPRARTSRRRCGAGRRPPSASRPPAGPSVPVSSWRQHRDPAGARLAGGADLLDEELLRVGDRHRAPGLALARRGGRGSGPDRRSRAGSPGRWRRVRRGSPDGRGCPPA